MVNLNKLQTFRSFLWLLFYQTNNLLGYNLFYRYTYCLICISLGVSTMKRGILLDALLTVGPYIHKKPLM